LALDGNAALITVQVRPAFFGVEPSPVPPTVATRALTLVSRPATVRETEVVIAPSAVWIWALAAVARDA